MADREMEKAEYGGHEEGKFPEPSQGFTPPRSEEGDPDRSQGRETQTAERSEEAKEGTPDTDGELREAAQKSANRWAGRTSEQASSIAHALRAAGKDLEEHGEGRIAHWSEDAANEVEKMARYLEEEDPRTMLREVQAFARRNPGAFVGGTFAAGLFLGRFLRAAPLGGERDPRPDTAPAHDDTSRRF